MPHECSYRPIPCYGHAHPLAEAGRNAFRRKTSLRSEGLWVTFLLRQSQERVTILVRQCEGASGGVFRKYFQWGHRNGPRKESEKGKPANFRDRLGDWGSSSHRDSRQWGGRSSSEVQILERANDFSDPRRGIVGKRASCLSPTGPSGGCPYVVVNGFSWRGGL
jgi:hypothetical protein